MHHRAAAWRRGSAIRGAAAAIDVPGLLGFPLQAALTHAVRRLARERPEVFDRLGPAREAVLLLCPEGLPLAIRLELCGARSTVSFTRPSRAGRFTAKISGPLPMLLGLFDGSVDADSAFFSRRIKVEGDTAAVTALHNVLDAAELSLFDLAPGPQVLRRAARALGARVVGAGRHA
jgi:predicted lipid carrier protein YhbT